MRTTTPTSMTRCVLASTKYNILNFIDFGGFFVHNFFYKPLKILALMIVTKLKCTLLLNTQVSNVNPNSSKMTSVAVVNVVRTMLIFLLSGQQEEKIQTIIPRNGKLEGLRYKPS